MPKVSRIKTGPGPSFTDLLKEALAGTPYGTYLDSGDFGPISHIKKRILGLPWGKSVGGYWGFHSDAHRIWIDDERAFAELKAAAERIEEKYKIAIEIFLLQPANRETI